MTRQSNVYILKERNHQVEVGRLVLDAHGRREAFPATHGSGVGELEILLARQLRFR